ncbi:peptidoglycan-N-acetylmuramic acid deacetylase [Halolactibacillus alkaliphilus]|nr:peptidoglycan-N-acetylmuramic acid deacetylase [Halolactibacillus alkaliphilus]
MVLISLIVITASSEVNAYGFGYKRSNDQSPPEIGSYELILEEGNGYYRDKTEEKVLYLTFDHGYEKGYTEGILDVLKEEEVPACFFVTGHYVRSASKIVKRMITEGHMIGNHTYHHYDLTTLTEDKFKREILKLEQAIRLLHPDVSMHYMRPPKGIFNEQTLKWTNDLGYRQMFWSIAYVDWHEDKDLGQKYAYNEVVEQLHPGAVILMHAVSEDNLLALSHIIKEAKAQGYRFSILDELVFKEKGHHLFW